MKNFIVLIFTASILMCCTNELIEEEKNQSPVESRAGGMKLTSTMRTISLCGADNSRYWEIESLTFNGGEQVITASNTPGFMMYGSGYTSMYSGQMSWSLNEISSFKVKFRRIDAYIAASTYVWINVEDAVNYEGYCAALVDVSDKISSTSSSFELEVPGLYFDQVPNSINIMLVIETSYDNCSR